MPKSAAISESDDAIPAAPQSCSDSTSPDDVSSTDDSMSFFPVKGSPICTEGTLLRCLVVELLAREDRRAPDPVAPGGRAVQDHRLTGRGQQPRRRRSTGGNPTHIALTRQLSRYIDEGRLAADGGHADAVAVVADAADRAREVPVGLGKAQAVEQSDWACAHRDDVAEDLHRPRWQRPGTARPRRDGCGSRP